MTECLKGYAELLRVQNQPDKVSEMEDRASKVKS